jgi:uncharacterized protein (TIGR02145 family)
MSEREIKSDQLQLRANGLHYAVNEEDPYCGKVVGSYQSGQKSVESAFKNGKLHGVTTEWYYNGQKKSEVAYEDGVKSGTSRGWYENGQLAAEGNYKDGKLLGKLQCWYQDGQRRELVDDIDGNTYLTIRIGSQVWMAENLKVTHYRNGDPIPNVANNATWGRLTTGAYCDFDNDSANVAIRGRLYNWYAVSDTRHIAPAGWHVPTDAEWQTLVDHLGGNSGGGKMKEAGTAHWYSPNEGATNESGFSARPGSYRNFFDGVFYAFIGSCAYFWSSSEDLSGTAWNRNLYCNSSDIDRYTSLKKSGFSVRCVKD